MTDLELTEVIRPPVQAHALQYWFDGDAANIQTTNVLSGSHLIDVSSLADGLHTLHYQVLDAKGEVYGFASKVFLKIFDQSMEASLHVTAQANRLQYWFDNDAGNAQYVNGLSGTYAIDVSALKDGLHTLHYQVMDAKGEAYGFASKVFLKIFDQSMEASLHVPAQASRLQYWFDNDAENAQYVNGLSGTYAIDVSALKDGLHTLHYQVVATNGRGYGIVSQVFLKLFDQSQENALHASVPASRLQYWFDSDAGNMKVVNALSGTYSLDVSTLDEGIHTLHYQVVGQDGTVFSQASDVFLIMVTSSSMPTFTATLAEKLQYWFDSDIQEMQTVIGLSGTYMLDASLLSDGLHTLHYQVIGADGMGYDIVSQVFLKLAEDISGNLMTDVPLAKELKYWFDTAIQSAKVSKVTGDVQTIDASTIQEGLHTLYYQIVYEDGRVSPVSAGIFLKNYIMPTQEGSNVITKYQYWVNENSGAVKTVNVPKASNPYTVYALLPIQQEPIRSYSFHFEITDGVPMIYAYHDLHVRFHDDRSYFVDDSRKYIDYSTKQDVLPVGELQNTQTFTKIAKNDIRWYTIDLAAGDTVAFKLSQPATIQVFAPSGEELFKTSESASIKWSGIHTWEDGTYYLAVHDVTGTRSTMTLDYMHMDKYDVVDWDVRTVGNGGCSTITFKGNGFRDLYAVDLVVAPGDTIHSVDVSHDSDAETAVTFDFTDASLGKYDAVFHFTEEDKSVSDVVTVEEAVDIELATNVSFPSTFLRGTSTTYTIKVTNKGNMTAYYVPLEIKLKINSVKNISEIHFDGYIAPTKLLEVLLSDSLE